jgi:hypothetical protein
MLYFTLLIAIAFYGVLYLFWMMVEPHLGQPTALLFYGRQMLIAPPDAEFIHLLKWSVIWIGVYLIVDLALSIMRRRTRARNKAARLQPVLRPAAPSLSPQEAGGDLALSGSQTPNPAALELAAS